MDTRLFLKALRQWQERNRIFRTFDRLTPSQQSQVMSDAAELKRLERAPITIDEVITESRKTGSR